MSVEREIVLTPEGYRRLKDEILGTYLADNMKTRVLGPEGEWEHIWPGPDEEPLNAQERFVTQAREAVRKQEDE